LLQQKLMTFIKGAGSFCMGIAGLIGVSWALFTFVVFLLDKFYSFYAAHIVLQIITIAFFSLFTLFLSIRIGSRNSFRTKVFCLVTIFFSLTILFALIYMSVYYGNKSKTLAFKVSNEIISEEANNELQRNTLLYLDYEKQQALATVFKLRAAEFYSEWRNIHIDSIGTLHLCKNYARQIKLTKNFTLLYTVKAYLYVIDVQKPYIKGCDVSSILSINDGESALFALPAEDKKFDLIIHAKNRLFDKLRMLESEKDLTDAIDTYMTDLETQKNVAEDKIHDIIIQKANLNITHFIFFSASIMTTVGSNDITPNSSFARYVVIIQSVVAIFFIAFAIDFIWKNRDK